VVALRIARHSAHLAGVGVRGALETGDDGEHQNCCS
jgi:hypothetical protein